MTDNKSGDDKDATESMGLLDANWVEECSPGVTLNIVALPQIADDTTSKSSIILCHGSGQRMHLSQLEPLRQRALQGCKDIRTIIDQAVRDRLQMFAVTAGLDKQNS